MTGVVRDAASGVPLEGARVTLRIGESKIVQVRSGANGRFAFAVAAEYVDAAFVCAAVKDGYMEYQLRGVVGEAPSEVELRLGRLSD